MFPDELYPDCQLDDVDQFDVLNGLGQWQQADRQAKDSVLGGFFNDLLDWDLGLPIDSPRPTATPSESLYRSYSSSSDSDTWPCPSEDSDLQASRGDDPISPPIAVSPQSSESTVPAFSFIVHERPRSRYTCTICDMECHSSQGLESHAKKSFHKVYRCPWVDCDKSFHRRDTFVRHKTHHNRPGTFNCWFCELMGQTRAFSRKDHLTHHFRKAHPGLDVEHPTTLPKQEFPASRSSSPAPSLSKQSALGKTTSSSYSKREIRDLQNALSRFFGPEDLGRMTKRLDLHNSSKEEVSKRLRSLILEQPLRCCSHASESVVENSEFTSDHASETAS